AAAAGNVGQGAPTFEGLLAGYRSPVTATEAKASYAPQLLNAQSYQFRHFVAPVYPPLALMARVTGKVDLQLTLDPMTGNVREARTISGHALLAPAAAAAARQWQFAVTSETVNVTI